VAVNRVNIPDAILVLLLVGGAWGTLNAIRTGRLRPLLIGFALVGLAFNTTMLQAYIVVPAFALTYLVTAPGSLRCRIGHLLADGMALAVVSGTWMLVVDANRPTSAPTSAAAPTTRC
jgi:4-amino-4-deoxy-L-arabinose transferase-like glycosyltransferase